MPATGQLSYEETLSALQGFLHEPVAVMVSGPETGWLPIAFLRGVIGRATTTGTGGDEAIMFSFSGEDADEDTGFFILAERFHQAQSEGDGEQVTIETADGTIRVYRDPKAAVQRSTD